jgi:pimeloyl-ACP methyl ester carboxylesterase
MTFAARRRGSNPAVSFHPIDSRRTINGVELQVTEWGGAGDTIFFGHPTGFFGKIWKPIIERLRARGYEGRIITFDQRGQGMSSKLDEGYAWRELVIDTTELVGELGLEGALGVGHSAGATFVASAAAIRPGSFRRLVLIDPILVGSMAKTIERAENNSSMSKRTRTRRLVYETREGMFEVLRDRAPYDSWTDEALRTYVELGTFDRPDGAIELLCPGRIEAQLYEGALEIDPLAEFERLQIPVLLVGADGSNAFREPLTRMSLDALSDGRYLEFENATHFIPMEYPDAIADLLVAECRA